MAKGFIDIVPAESVHDRLKLSPNAPSLESNFKPLGEWSPQTDDAPILRYLFRQLQPRRHIEFGPSPDASPAYCLEECEATIWRTSPPRAAAPAAVSNAVAHRLWQRFGDSGDWDRSTFSPGFFDSALINGGGTVERVADDSRTALSLVRSGGLIIWRDFCPDPGLFDVFDSVDAMVRGVVGNWKELKGSLDDAFWIRPSLLLTAIRR